MKIITWNMDNWQQKADNRAEAWKFLINQNVDIALLQETKPTQDSDLLAEYSLDFNPSSGLNWGSAILMKKQYRIIKKYAFQSSYVGAETLMVYEIGVGEEIVTVINIYGKHAEGYCSTTMHHILSDITPFLHQNKQKNILLAGDFNVAREWDDNNNDPLHSTIFDRLEDKNLGLVNVTKEQYGGVVKTRSLYQLDYVYATKPLYQKISLCNVLPLTDFSDHCPIEVEFDV